MYICKNCGKTYDNYSNFCSSCGGNDIVLQPVEIHTPHSTYGAGEIEPPRTTYGSVPVSSHISPVAVYGRKESISNGPSIVSLVLGCVALVLSFILFICMAEFVDSYSYSYFYNPFDELMGMFTGFSVFILPGVIVGLIMSFKETRIKGLSIGGKVTNFVALGLYVTSFIMCLSFA